MKKSILLCFAMIPVLALVACGPVQGDQEGTGVGFLGMNVSAATNTCSGAPAPTPLDQIDRIRVLVNNLTVKDKDGVDVPICKCSKVDVEEGIAEIDGIREGQGRVVTVLGYSGNNSNPSWFGRARNVNIVEDRASDIDMVLSRYDSFTCISQQFAGGVTQEQRAAQEFVNTAFPAAIRLGDGRVFISGGLTGKVSRGEVDGAQEYELNTPTNKAFIYDPASGVFEFAGNMNVARAGHAMAYVAIGGRDSVVIFGGTDKVIMRTGGNFPFSFDSESAFDSIEVYDVKDGTFTVPLHEGGAMDGQPKTMALRRAFHNVGRMGDNSVLIVGGGEWPVDETDDGVVDESSRIDYRKAEIWAPYADGGRGGMLEMAGSLTMSTQHNGGTMLRIADTGRGLSRFLIIGGTTNRESVIEVFTQSSKQEEGVPGVFKVRTDADFASLNYDKTLPKMFFPSVVQIASDASDITHERFLITYGAFESSKLIKADAYKIGSATQMAYELRLYEDTSNVAKADQKDGVRMVPIIGDCARRAMGSMFVSHDRKSVVMFGGFAGNSGVSNLGTCKFDATRTSFDKNDAFEKVPAGDSSFLSRGGFASVSLPDDTILLVGGMISVDTLGADGPGMIEVYTPEMLWTPEMFPECMTGGAPATLTDGMLADLKSELKECWRD